MLIEVFQTFQACPSRSSPFSFQEQRIRVHLVFVRATQSQHQHARWSRVFNLMVHRRDQEFLGGLPFPLLEFLIRPKGFEWSVLKVDPVNQGQCCVSFRLKVSLQRLESVPWGFERMVRSCPLPHRFNLQLRSLFIFKEYDRNLLQAFFVL